MEHHLDEACVLIYAAMGLYAESVELALKVRTLYMYLYMCTYIHTYIHTYVHVHVHVHVQCIRMCPCIHIQIMT